MLFLGDKQQCPSVTCSSFKRTNTAKRICFLRKQSDGTGVYAQNTLKPVYMRTLFSLNVHIGSINKWGSRYFIQLLFRAHHHANMRTEHRCHHRFAVYMSTCRINAQLNQHIRTRRVLVCYTHSVRVRVLFCACNNNDWSYIRRLLHELELTDGSSSDTFVKI